MRRVGLDLNKNAANKTKAEPKEVKPAQKK